MREGGLRVGDAVLGPAPRRSEFSSRLRTIAPMAPRVIPLCRIGPAQSGAVAAKSFGAAIGIRLRPMLTATTIWFRRSPRSAPPTILRPAAATMPKITMPAPPSTAGGIDATAKATLGRRLTPRMMKPAATVT